jgi:hypothetical protein
MNSDFKDDQILLVYLEVVMLSPFMDLLSFIFFKINGHAKEEEIKAHTKFQNTQLTNGMSASLQVVMINDISCLSNEMWFIELVLSKEIMLRTMSITLDGEFSRSDEDVLNKLKTYRRASPHAHILLQKVIIFTFISKC